MQNLDDLIYCSKKLNLLYVEDEAEGREITLKILKIFFSNIVVAVDGEDGFKKFQDNDIDLVITDISMPKLDGLAMLEKIKTINKDIYCIILSAKSDSNLFMNSIKIGVDGYILKPIELNQYIEVYTKIITKIKVINENLEQRAALDKIYEYDTAQQKIAKSKLENVIVNSLEKNHKILKSDIIFKPSDILSGDFYSIYTLKNGDIFAYIIDGQGHGIMPALSIFAISSTIYFLSQEVDSIDDLVCRLFPAIQKFLADEEQLSYSMLSISSDMKNLKYLLGGMYPLMINSENNILRYKANNLPYMNFSDIPNINEVEITNWESIIIYSDGIIEDTQHDMNFFTPSLLLNDKDKFEMAKEIIKKNMYEDDITVLKITKL